jgi:hypothetical protein
LAAGAATGNQIAVAVVRLKRLGLVPDSRRSMEKLAVQATKGNQDFYGEGKI